MQTPSQFCTLPKDINKIFVEALHSALKTGGPHATHCIESLLDAVKPNDHKEARVLALLANGVAEHLLHDQPIYARLQQEIVTRFAQRGGKWPWEDRLDVLEALGRLGDPRLPDPRILQTYTPQTGWVQVKAGAYRIGGPGELAEQDVNTDGFWIRTWPVTVAEYQAFVAAGGEAPDDWFMQQRRPNRPVVYVSWYQARAFCVWAQKAWRLPEIGVVDLPTSMEWEVAMRRGTGRTYPWGKPPPAKGDQAQAAYDWEDDPFAKRRGAPVGAFPLGHTPEQGLEGPLWDAAGNVWEWCASVFGEEAVNDKMHRQADDNVRQAEDKIRVVRGGSWNFYSRRLRAAYRLGGPPRHRSDYFGFRVLVRVPGL